VSSSLIYLDYNATTPIDPRVLEKMMPFLKHEYGNAASHDHALGWNAAEAVEEARYHVAELINAKSTEIIFTGSATESINMALKGLAFAALAPESIVTSEAEHEAVLGVCRQLARHTNVKVQYLPVDSCARISPRDLGRALSSQTKCVVAIMAANNEIGTINPVAELAAITHAAGGLFFTDATQAIGKITVDVQEIDADLLAFSSHKVYGPKGVGALFLRARKPKTDLEPLTVGGGHERGLRAGTLNVPGIVGFGEACRLAKLESSEDAARIKTLRDVFEARLSETVPGLRINGSGAPRLPNTASLIFPGVDARTLLRDVWALAASTKSACSSGDARPSHVLTAIGLSEDDAYCAVRFSLGRYTTSSDIDDAIVGIGYSARRLAQRSPGSGRMGV
jgi:cysteine desulfurase